MQQNCGSDPHLGAVNKWPIPSASIFAHPIGCRFPVTSAVRTLGVSFSFSSNVFTPGSSSSPFPALRNVAELNQRKNINPVGAVHLQV